MRALHVVNIVKPLTKLQRLQRAVLDERGGNGAAMVPIVVIGDSVNTLGVMRSLAREKMPIYLICSTWRCAAAWSRYCRVVRARELTDVAFGIRWSVVHLLLRSSVLA